jgi:hypothetical protein
MIQGYIKKYSGKTARPGYNPRFNIKYSNHNVNNATRKKPNSNYSRKGIKIHW